MKAQLVFKMAMAVMILALTVVPGLAQGLPGLAQELPEMAVTTPASDVFAWSTAYVDESGDRGTNTAIAFDPSTDTPWISYYDLENEDLMVAHRVSINGNCGPNDGWNCETVDSTGNVGLYSSIDIYPDPDPDVLPNFPRVGVTYYDATNGALKFAAYSCSYMYPFPCSWSIVTIEEGGTYMGAPDYGLYTSIKYSLAGAPHISYYMQSSMYDDELRYTYSVDSGGNCGEGSAAGSWQCDSVDSGSGVGQYTSLDLAYGASNNVIPVIAYYHGNNDNLMLAEYTGWEYGGYCTNVNWYCYTIDGVGADMGRFASFSLNGGFAYYDDTNGKLRYAYHVESGTGNCASSSYQCVDIDDASPGSRGGISLATDSCGNPLIAYRHVESEESQLRVARPLSSLGLPPSSGNCGPVVGTYPSWQCLTVDAGSGGAMQNFAEGVSAAFDPDGNPMIAYSEWVLTMSGGDTDLKIADWCRIAFLPLIYKDTP